MKNNKIQMIEARFPKGTRVKCIDMHDKWAVPSGTCGTVMFVDAIGTIHVNWDNGSTLGLIIEEDEFMKIPNNKQ